jgi:hypothetical protein
LGAFYIFMSVEGNDNKRKGEYSPHAYDGP